MKIKKQRCKSSLGGCKDSAAVKTQPSTDLNLCDRWQPMSKCEQPKQALEIYEQILAAAQQQQNRLLEETTLKMIAELHLGWFDYPSSCYL